MVHPREPNAPAKAADGASSVVLSARSTGFVQQFGRIAEFD
jgi:hypothetical protein